jgi:hypothetical protein
MTDFGVRISEVILSEISGSVHAWMLVLKTCLGDGCAPWSIWGELPDTTEMRQHVSLAGAG